MAPRLPAGALIGASWGAAMIRWLRRVVSPPGPRIDWGSVVRVLAVKDDAFGPPAVSLLVESAGQAGPVFIHPGTPGYAGVVRPLHRHLPGLDPGWHAEMMRGPPCFERVLYSRGPDGAGGAGVGAPGHPQLAGGAWAEFCLISDFPVGPGQLLGAEALFGRGTTRADVRFGPDRKTCRWPLWVDDPGDPAAPSTLVWACAAFLKRRRATVEGLRASGCNLELCVHAPTPLRYFSVAAGTMAMMAELEVQLSLVQQEGNDGG
jgi:hypothetical protein